MARLRRVSDGLGDEGARVEALAWNEDRTFKGIVGHKPIVGCSLLVGSVTARSYSDQDFWLTTVIIEILEEREGYCRFRTQNSEYEFFQLGADLTSLPQPPPLLN